MPGFALEVICPENAAFSIETASGGKVLVNPSGERPAGGGGDDAVALFTRLHGVAGEGPAPNSLIDRPGEYELGSTYIQGIAVGERTSSSDALNDFRIVYVLNDGVTSVGVFAELNVVPDKHAEEKIGNLNAVVIDISNSTLTPDALASTIRSLDIPVIVIRADSIEAPVVVAFAKELGVTEVQPQKRFTVKPSGGQQGKSVVVALRSA